MNVWSLSVLVNAAPCGSGKMSAVAVKTCISASPLKFLLTEILAVKLFCLTDGMNRAM